MKHKNILVIHFTVLAFLLGLSLMSYAQNDLTWLRTYMGQWGHNVFPTCDGGYMIAAGNGGEANCCKPWLIRIDSYGNVLWQKIYTNGEMSPLQNVQPTEDGGYIMSSGSTVFILTKLDAHGNIEWSKNYGDGGYFYNKVLVSPKGDYLIYGMTTLLDTMHLGNGRAVLVNKQGDIIWQKVYGESGVNEYFTDATLGYNDSFVIVGMRGGDFWIMKLDWNGDIIWQLTMGGPAEDEAYTVTKLPDKMYMVTGSTESYGPSIWSNLWIIRIADDGGKIYSQQTIGGEGAEYSMTSIRTSDDGVMIGGATTSYGAGNSDMWLIKFDKANNMEWQKTYGTELWEHASHLAQLPEGGFIVIGNSYAWPAIYNIVLMKIDEKGSILYDQCAKIGEPDFKLVDTDARPQSINLKPMITEIKPVDVKITVEMSNLPIDTCVPHEIRK